VETALSKFIASHPLYDINTADNDGFTPLLIACARADLVPEEHTALVKMLLQHKADPKMRTAHSLSSALHFAARCANGDVIRLLKDAVPTKFEETLLNCPNWDDETPLSWACLGGNYDAFIALLEVKVRVEQLQY